MDKILDSILNFNGIHKWQHIIIHHSASIDGDVNDWEVIKKFHTSWRFKDEIITAERARQLRMDGIMGVVAPWKDIGYHAGVEYENGMYVFKEGRSLNMDGAHTQSMNDVALGICIVGNFDRTPPCHLQYDMAAQLCRAYIKRFGIFINNIHPHHEFATYKTCPGLSFNLNTLKDYIEKGGTKIG